jgi:hypothetical protein
LKKLIEKKAKLDVILTRKRRLTVHNVVKVGRNMLNLITLERYFQRQFICERINEIENPNFQPAPKLCSASVVDIIAKIGVDS